MMGHIFLYCLVLCLKRQRCVSDTKYFWLLKSRELRILQLNKLVVKYYLFRALFNKLSYTKQPNAKYNYVSLYLKFKA